MLVNPILFYVICFAVPLTNAQNVLLGPIFNPYVMIFRHFLICQKRLISLRTYNNQVFVDKHLLLSLKSHLVWLQPQNAGP